MVNGLPQVKITPRMISMQELRRHPVIRWIIDNVPGASDDLMDIWNMGAPSPDPAHAACPPGTCAFHAQRFPPCDRRYGCARERRLLLPSQFEVFWQRVQQRIGAEVPAEAILKQVH